MKKVLLVLCVCALFSCGKSDEEVNEMLNRQREMLQEDLANKEAEEQRVADSISEAKETELKNSPRFKEKNNPLKYVKILASKNEPDYLGNLKFEVTIKNGAKYTTYKEAVIVVEWLGKNNVVLATNNVIESGHSYQPGEVHVVKFKTKTPSGDVKSYRAVLKNVYYNGQL